MASIKVAPALGKHHYEHAELFRDRALRIESIYSDIEPDEGGSIPEEDLKRHRAFVTTAIISAVSFAEAKINRLFWAVEDDWERVQEDTDPVHFPRLTAEERQAVIDAKDPDDSDATALESRLKHAGPMGKYNTFLAIIGKTEFDSGEPPAEPFNAVLDLRNKLVHHRPRWVQGGERNYTENEYGIEENLQDRFPLNPLIASGGEFFPSQCLSYGCAEWAVRVTGGFVRQFEIRVGIDLHSNPTLE